MFLFVFHISYTFQITGSAQKCPNRVKRDQKGSNRVKIYISQTIVRYIEILVNWWDWTSSSFATKIIKTLMCTWLVLESISNFNRNGSDVFSCFMDMNKAFDTVKHSLLFQKLIETTFTNLYQTYAAHVFAPNSKSKTLIGT